MKKLSLRLLRFATIGKNQNILIFSDNFIDDVKNCCPSTIKQCQICYHDTDRFNLFIRNGKNLSEYRFLYFINNFKKNSFVHSATLFHHISFCIPANQLTNNITF